MKRETARKLKRLARRAKGAARKGDVQKTARLRKELLRQVRGMTAANGR